MSRRRRKKAKGRGSGQGRSSYDVFKRHFERASVEGVISSECFHEWISLRTVQNGPDSFRKSIQAHLVGAAGRRPFPEEMERELVHRLRKKEVWPMARDLGLNIGRYGVRAEAFHEKQRRKTRNSSVEAIESIEPMEVTDFNTPSDSLDSFEEVDFFSNEIVSIFQDWKDEASSFNSQSSGSEPEKQGEFLQPWLQNVPEAVHYLLDCLHVKLEDIIEPKTPLLKFYSEIFRFIRFQDFEVLNRARITFLSPSTIFLMKESIEEDVLGRLTKREFLSPDQDSMEFAPIPSVYTPGLSGVSRLVYDTETASYVRADGLARNIFAREDFIGKPLSELHPHDIVILTLAIAWNYANLIKRGHCWGHFPLRLSNGSFRIIRSKWRDIDSRHKEALMQDVTALFQSDHEFLGSFPIW